MKRLLMTLAGLTSLLVVFIQPASAQDKEKEDKAKSRSKNEEIIIRRKSDKDTKVTIEIKGDEVLVNGKPADEYEDENISISKHRSVTGVISRSPFRAQSGTWSYGGNNFEMGGEVAFLGVTSDDHEKGAKILQVTDESAADKAGLKSGDIITKVDETKIESPDNLTKAIRKHKPEEKEIGRAHV